LKFRTTDGQGVVNFGRSMNAPSISVGLLIVLFVILLLRWMRRLKPQLGGLQSQRMCPSCGLITSRLKARCFHQRDHGMQNIKFLVRVNRGDRASAYVQRVDPTPIHMTTNRKLALGRGRLTAEDAAKYCQNNKVITTVTRRLADANGLMIWLERSEGSPRGQAAWAENRSNET